MRTKKVSCATLEGWRRFFFFEVVGSHRIYVWNIYLHFVDFYAKLVGKYTHQHSWPTWPRSSWKLPPGSHWPPFFIGWFPNQKYYSRGSSSSKRKFTIFKSWHADFEGLLQNDGRFWGHFCSPSEARRRRNRQCLERKRDRLRNGDLPRWNDWGYPSNFFFQRDSIEEGAMSDHLFVGWAGTKESAVGCFNWNRCLFFADEKFILKDYT